MLLLRYLKTFNFDVEKAQTLLQYSLEIRASNPHIFTNRDILSPELESVFNTWWIPSNYKVIIIKVTIWFHSEIVPMLTATPENFKVCILRLKDFNSDKFAFDDIVKGFFMMADLRLISPDPNEELADGEVPIFDMAGVTIWHALKIHLATLKLYFKYVQEVSTGTWVWIKCQNLNNFRHTRCVFSKYTSSIALP